MAVTRDTRRRNKAPDYKDFVHTGPGTTAGRYMRLFWQPVYRSLPDERAKKIRPEASIDPTPWDRALKGGLVERLYGKKESLARQP
jgi:hypothetical protein